MTLYVEPQIWKINSFIVSMTQRNVPAVVLDWQQVYKDHHISLRLRWSFSSKFSRAASCLGSHHVIMGNESLQSTHRSLERHELFSSPSAHPAAQQFQYQQHCCETLSITDAKSLQRAILMCSLSAWRREKWVAWESLSPYTLKQTLCPRPTPASHRSKWYTHTNNSGDLFLIGALVLSWLRLCWGCCKSRLSSESEVWRNILSLFSTLSGSTSPAGGGTHSFTLWNITFSPSCRYHGSRYKKIFFS